MPTLRTLLILRECRNRRTPDLLVYKDTVGVLTVGIGHKVLAPDKLKFGDRIDIGRANAFYKADTARAVAAAKRQAAKAGITNGQFVIALAAVNFQLGTRWYTKLKKTWRLMLDGDYPAAAAEAARSKWNGQSRLRVRDFQKALLALDPPTA